MDALSFHIAFLVFEFGLRSIRVDYDITIYQLCNVVPCDTQRRGDISILAVYNGKVGMLVVSMNTAVRIYFV